MNPGLTSVDLLGVRGRRYGSAVVVVVVVVIMMMKMMRDLLQHLTSSLRTGASSVMVICGQDSFGFITMFTELFAGT